MTYHSACTIDLLIAASDLAYYFHHKNMVPQPRIRSSLQNSLETIVSRGYSVSTNIHTLTPETQSNLGAVLLVPKDSDSAPEAPIVLAFRGTIDSIDIKEDVRLTLQGTITENYRKEAYKIYQESRKDYPGREIVVTGHSLGGHIAQYVAARAYHENPEEDITVRTFNTAAIHKKYSKLVQGLNKTDRFVHYRLENDIVSLVQERVGHTYSFPTSFSKGADAHILKSVEASLPPEILSQRVGGKDPLNLLKEKIQGSLASYQCRVNNQLLSQYRIAFQKNKLLRNQLLTTLNLISRTQLNMAEEARLKPDPKEVTIISQSLHALKASIYQLQNKGLAVSMVDDLINSLEKMNTTKGFFSAIQEKPDTHSEERPTAESPGLQRD